MNLFWRFGQGRIDGAGKGMHVLRPVRVPDPQGRAAARTEPALGRALLPVDPGMEDGYGLFTLNCQAIRPTAEVDREAPTPAGLA